MKDLFCSEKALFTSDLMRAKGRYLIIFFLFFCVFATPIKADVVFNNGQYNPVDYFIDDNVEINNNTTVDLLTGGIIMGYARTWDSSKSDCYTIRNGKRRISSSFNRKSV